MPYPPSFPPRQSPRTPQSPEYQLAGAQPCRRSGGLPTPKIPPQAASPTCTSPNLKETPRITPDSMPSTMPEIFMRSPWVIQEAWIGGVSTRRVDDLVQAMGLTGISKSTVSKLCKDIDERVNAFLDRPLAGDWPYLWLDATYLKQREGGRIVSVAAIIAVAVNTDGRREIVGLHIGPSEAETFWSTFLKSMLRRGLRGVKLVISDAHEGLKTAIRRVMGASWQRCRVHWMRNALSYVPKAQQSMVAAALRQAFIQPDRSNASQTLRHVADQLRGKWPKLGAFIDDSEIDVLAHMDFPAQHRTKIHSTNPLERLNKEVKRRSDVVGIFPNEGSIIRLIGAVLLEANDEWQTQNRYMQIEAMAELAPLLIDIKPAEITTVAA
ncbi:putative transposase [Acidiphilium multivorum AIU301]|uniref:Mutator family transposase n=1 Tax=Acidiphilium multivorum (strain DSM 11245 / JCM 8867 / NBRC 100883 / AIU 301) TaxID=926570 RepID=F0IZZ6_ACIMA|nr:putative transposase [Acidiphilium multivorum AIU301]